VTGATAAGGLVGVAPELHAHGEATAGLAAAVWRFPGPVLVVSSAPLGGGLGLCRWVLNAQVPATYDRLDPAEHLTELAAALGLEGGGVGMLTAVDVRTMVSRIDGGARADVSVGLGHPTWAADEDGAHQPPGAGTVNVVAALPERLSEAALVNAVVTVTEAKSQALWEAGVPATGTASDAVCVVCPPDGAAHAFGGPRSPWGSRLARAVHGAVAAGASRGAPR